MKLYSWIPRGHGQLSFFVCADSYEKARAAVVDRLRGCAEYEYRGWGTEYYAHYEYDPMVVVEHEND